MKNKHIRGIIIDIVTIALCITAIFVGVFSVKNANLNISGEIGFEKHEPVESAYLASDWCTKIADGFGIDIGYTTKVSFVYNVDSNTLASYDKDTDGSTIKSVNVKSTEKSGGDILAYYNSTDKTIIVSSQKEIFAPENCSDFCSSFRYEKKGVQFSDLVSIDFDNFNTSNVTNMSKMFYNVTSLKTINLSKFDTSKVTNLSYMFYFTVLETLDLSNFDTSNVENMSGMFSTNSSLNKIDILNFNTSKVTDMSYMFNSTGFENLDLRNLNSTQVTNMKGMFSSMSSLVSLNLSSLDTSSVTNMERMFYHCNNLKSLDVSSFDTSKVTNMSYMFAGCTKLSALNISSFNTSNVTTFDSMFSNCEELENIDVSTFNTSNATSLWNMFGYCSKLVSLDLSSFNTSKITYMGYMFRNCTLLKTIYVSSLWTVENVTSSGSMFSGCGSLKGAVEYDSTKVDATMANYESGYLTLKQ